MYVNGLLCQYTNDELLYGEAFSFSYLTLETPSGRPQTRTSLQCKLVNLPDERTMRQKSPALGTSFLFVGGSSLLGGTNTALNAEKNQNIS